MKNMVPMQVVKSHEQLNKPFTEILQEVKSMNFSAKTTQYSLLPNEMTMVLSKILGKLKPLL